MEVFTHGREERPRPEWVIGSKRYYNRKGSDTVPYRTGFDPGSEPVSDAVVRALSEATGRGVDDLEPINGVVDPIVLDALVRRRGPPIRLEFTSNDRAVTVVSDGEITVRDTEHRPHDDVSTREGLEAELGRLLRAAESNGVDVEGSYVSPVLTGRSEWEIEVVEMRRTKESD